MSLDIAERWILVHYPNDNIPYHRRVLLAKLEGARWIWSTPDFSVGAVALSDSQGAVSMVPLQRGQPYPPNHQIYGFDNPTTAQDLARIRAEARALAEILGAAVPPVAAGHAAPDGAVYLFSDPSCSFFSEEVDDHLLGSEATAIARGAVCLVKRGEEWTTAERGTAADKLRWMQEKLCGESRGSRMLPLARCGTP